MAEETIKNLIDSIDNAEEEIQNFLSKITSEGFDTQDLGDMTTIAAFFSLPDDLFDELKEHVIQEIIRECNDPAFLNNISYSIKKDNITADQLSDELSGIEKIIDEYESEVLTPNKKEFLKRLMYGMYNIILQNEFKDDDKIIVPIETCRENAKIPRYAHVTDAGVDFYSTDEYVIAPGETVLIPTGLKMAIPEGYALLIQPRSGLSRKTKLRICNTPGLIDRGYRDEIGVLIENTEPKIKNIIGDYDSFGNYKIDGVEYGQDYVIEKGMRFAQGRFVKVPTAIFKETNDVRSIGEDRGGGFGSSGVL
jgi:dUTP pyrophosphatase